MKNKMNLMFTFWLFAFICSIIIVIANEIHDKDRSCKDHLRADYACTCHAFFPLLSYLMTICVFIQLCLHCKYANKEAAQITTRLIKKHMRETSRAPGLIFAILYFFLVLSYFLEMRDSICVEMDVY